MSGVPDVDFSQILDFAKKGGALNLQPLPEG